MNISLNQKKKKTPFGISIVVGKDARIVPKKPGLNWDLFNNRA